MYVQVGYYPDARRLAELAARLNPKPSEQGYCTTDRDATYELYYPHFKDTFLNKWDKCFLAIIWANGSIPPHTDGDSILGGTQRFQVVLQTNANSWVMHGGDWQQLVEGGIYTMRPDVTHASINWGGEPRINLIVDVLP